MLEDPFEDVVEVLDDPDPVDERLARLHGVRP
jgi:hypothetical protein